LPSATKAEAIQRLLSDAALDRDGCKAASR
jgi:hypothetical protein